MKKKLEFVKRMYIVNFVFVVLITIFTFIAVFTESIFGIVDVSPLTQIVSCSWVELGTFSGFYCWKSKCENIHKYPDITEKSYKINSDIESVG